MSSISATQNTGLYSFLQSLTGASSGANPSDASAGLGSLSSSGDSTASNPLVQEIQQAVLGALQSGQSKNGSSDSSSSIQNAIAQVLGGVGSNSSSSQSDPAANPANSADASSSFQQTLEKYGVSAQQFHSDYQSAVQNMLGNTGSLSSGLLVDAMG